MKSRNTDELTAYLGALALAMSSPAAAVLDEMALGDLVRVELNVPQGSKNEDARKAWECCARARDAATSMKANYWLRRAMVCAKDFMLWDDAIKGEKFTSGRPRGGLGPIAKRIKAHLKENPSHTADQVWEILAKKPPRGMVFMETSKHERYIEKGAKTVMKWERFQNLVSGHRPKK